VHDEKMSESNIKGYRPFLFSGTIPYIESGYAGI